jgi:hypothetical protein
MKYALGVCSGQSCAKLARDIERLVRWKPSDPVKKGSQIFAIHVFHRKEMMTVYVSNVVYPANVRMRNATSGTDFIVKTLEKSLIVRGFVWKKLQGDRLA